MGIQVRKPTFWSRCELKLKRRSYRVLEKLFSRNVISPQNVTLKDIRSVLVIRQHDQLGDFLLATPALRALREALPNGRIGLVTREYTKDVASMIPFVDEVLVFYERINRWTFPRLRTLWKGLRKRWDLCIVLNTVSHSLTSDLLAHLSAAPLVLGSSGHVFPGCRRNFFYNLLAPVQDEARHQTERNLDIVRYIGMDTLDRREVIFVPEGLRQQACDHLRKRGIVLSKPIIGFHIGAGKPENRWPTRSFAELARLVHRAHGAQVLVFWGPAEADLLKAFCAEVTTPFVKIPPTSLRSLAAFFSQCDVVVCNDSGPLHVAAATGTATLGLFGNTDPTIWKPPGDAHESVRSPDGKIESIPASAVLDKIHGLIERSKKTADAPSHLELQTKS